MNDEIDKKLQELVAAADKEKTATELRPKIINKAIADYLLTQQQIEEKVNEFNGKETAQRLFLKLRLDRGVDRGDSVHYILKLLRDGRIESRTAVEIIMPPSIEHDFDEARIIVQDWTSNYGIENVTEHVNYFPGDEPKSRNAVKYKLNIVDKTYEWISERPTQSIGKSFPELITSIIYERLVSQLQ